MDFQVAIADAKGSQCSQPVSISVDAPSGPCDGITKVYQITGYGPGIAAAIAAQFPTAVASAMTEWDGIFRQRMGPGSFGVHPECYAIAGKSIDLFDSANRLRDISCGVPGPPPGWQPDSGHIFPNTCVLIFPFFNPCAITYVGPPIYMIGGFDGTTSLSFGNLTGRVGSYGLVSPPPTMASDCSSTVSGLTLQSQVIGTSLFTLAVY